MPTARPRRRLSKLDRRCALGLLASLPDGCSEAIMLAHGFSVPQMVELVRSGLASATTKRVVAGREKIEVATLRITDAGRRALVETERLKCPRCQDTGWVCETHDNRPWYGEKACGCSAAGKPCPSCNPANADNPPPWWA